MQFGGIYRVSMGGQLTVRNSADKRQDDPNLVENWRDIIW